MQDSIVYLRPQGPGLFRSGLRSDTLWGALCWAIRMVYKNGDAVLNNLLDAYAIPDNTSGAFYLSSAFPFVFSQDEAKYHFLPHPFEPYRNQEPEAIPTGPSAQKNMLRDEKRRQKQLKWIAWEVFSARFCGDDRNTAPSFSPIIGTRAMTHNSIDRTRLGTIETQNGGLLFHTNENYLSIEGRGDLSGWESGLYFLVKGNFSILEPALRFLEHFGIAGDRGTGKGHFRIDWEEVKIPESPEPNARFCLSLYHPSESEAGDLDKSTDRVFRYQLADRQGRHLMERDYLQNGYFCFGEGSVFPILPNSKQFPGKNIEVRAEDRSSDIHRVHRYGHAFMLDIKIS